MQNRTYKLWLNLILLSLILSTISLPAQAQGDSSLSADATQSSALSISNDDHGVAFRWNLPNPGVNAASASDAAVLSMPVQRFGGYMLPMELSTHLLSDDAKLSAAGAQDASSANLIDVSELSSLEYYGPLTIAKPEEPKAIDWEKNYETPQETLQLPTSPIFILREGRVRGQRVAVVAFSPIYEDEGTVKIASTVQANMKNAKPLEGGIGQLMNVPVKRADVTAAELSASTAAPLAFTPTNPAVFQSAVKIHVADPGIQRVAGTTLIANGVPAATALTNIKVAYKGSEIAIELWDNGNGTLDASDELRFYADHGEYSGKVGDYWNEQEIYWLTFSGSNGLRMANRNVTPSGASTASPRSTAMEQGIWEDNLIYESTMQGKDGDNWFSADLTVTPTQVGSPSTYPTATITLNNKLPLATSVSLTSQFSITGSSRTVSNHSLSVNWGSTSKNINWTNLQHYESFTQVVSSTTSHPQTIKLTLLPGALDSSIRLDKIYWSQPVNLDFGNGGATFYGVSGISRYQLVNVTSDAALYDISDASKPTRLVIPTGSSPQFEDGPVARRYILATVNDLHQPTLSSHTAVSWPTSMRAHGLYIGYSEFHDALQPLLNMRTAQGFEVLAIDLQSVYDSWSFGQISPDAVRNFLQYAVNNWALAPLSAVAIGDTTVDPKNYQGRMDGSKNKNIFPAFLESIDPWLGETTCESCFVQLDDLHPLDGIQDKNFLVDMWFGRFSVQDESQLEDIVSKIISYESATDLGLNVRWRQTSVYVADNYVRSDCTVDSAGDFAKASDEIIEHFQDPNMISNRIYYDPSSRLDPSCTYYDSVVKPGHYATPNGAKAAALNAYKTGAGLITFDGHSNHFQNGRIEETDEFIFGFNDIPSMKNTDRLPIILEMTCYTGQFTYLSTTGTTMDERFQRQADGGAIAVMAPSGLSVATGHHFMQEGFHQYLASSGRYQSRLGQLMEASYFNLFERGTCCQDVRKTFLLLGDPLTQALVQAPDLIYLPMVEK